MEERRKRMSEMTTDEYKAKTIKLATEFFESRLASESVPTIENLHSALDYVFDQAHLRGGHDERKLIDELRKTYET